MKHPYCPNSSFVLDDYDVHDDHYDYYEDEYDNDNESWEIQRSSPPGHDPSSVVALHLPTNEAQGTL